MLSQSLECQMTKDVFDKSCADCWFWTTIRRLGPRWEQHRWQRRLCARLGRSAWTRLGGGRTSRATRTSPATVLSTLPPGTSLGSTATRAASSTSSTPSSRGLLRPPTARVAASGLEPIRLDRYGSRRRSSRCTDGHGKLKRRQGRVVVCGPVGRARGRLKRRHRGGDVRHLGNGRVNVVGPREDLLDHGFRRRHDGRLKLRLLEEGGRRVGDRASDERCRRVEGADGEGLRRGHLRRVAQGLDRRGRGQANDELIDPGICTGQ